MYLLFYGKLYQIMHCVRGCIGACMIILQEFYVIPRTEPSSVTMGARRGGQEGALAPPPGN